MTKKLFISYSKDNHDVADRLLKQMKIYNAGHGNEIEFFLDVERLQAGFEWNPVIQQSLRQAHAYLFLVSLDALSSPYIEQHELPAMAFEHRSAGCPFFLFLVGPCPYGDFPVAIDGSREPLTLGSLEAVGPKQDNRRPAWFNELDQQLRDSALADAAEIVCSGTLQSPVERMAVRAAAEKLPGATSPGPVGNVDKRPSLEHFIAYLDRRQIADSVLDELATHMLVAVVTQAAEPDWVEGMALRFGYPALEDAAAAALSPLIQRTEWPLLDRPEESRERALWMDLPPRVGVTSPAEGEFDFARLWPALQKALGKQVRVVIHYKLRASRTRLKQDMRLLQRLAERWSEFLAQLDTGLPGRIVLLFSIDQDPEPQSPIGALFGSRSLRHDDIYKSLCENLEGGTVIMDEAGECSGCSIIKGGELLRIFNGDAQDWRQEVVQTGISRTHSDTLILAVEDNIPGDGIRHLNLKQKVRKDPKVRELFKIT